MMNPRCIPARVTAGARAWTALAGMAALVGCDVPGPIVDTAAPETRAPLTFPSRERGVPKPRLPTAGSALGPARPAAPAAPPVATFQPYAGLRVSVVGPQGETITGYRWTLEEDATYPVAPGLPDPHTLSVGFHRSYMPVLAHGTDRSSPLAFVPDPAKHYFLSVLPDQGYTMGGTRLAGGDTAVTVRCTAAPLPTAQVTVFVFQDTAPLNGAPDLPEEPGLAGFQVLLYEAGGRYGMAGGQVMQDVFANPVGTTYLPDGSVDQVGPGYVLTDENGNATIKNLSQGKFTIEVIPPRGQGWVQTSTIEGMRGSDAWVKPQEPGYFQEFGPPGWHTFFGFAKEMQDTSVLTGGATLSGQAVNNHEARPPNYAFYAGAPFDFTHVFVALNDMSSANGRTVYIQRTQADGSFAIPHVPAGNWQLTFFDDNLDLIMGNHTVVVPPKSGPMALGAIPLFQWFSNLRAYAFHDDNGNGRMDPGERGIPEVPVNIRWRDGTMYGTNNTTDDGSVNFNEVFPFFAWQVVEVDTARFKPTGLTVLVDNGGPVNPADPNSFGGRLTPQLQPENNNLPYRTEPGAFTEAFQAFIGTTNVIQFGKTAFGPGETGGISGTVYYDTMRGCDDARFSHQEPHEPGIPHVQVNLYRDGRTALKADVDNYPFGNFPGPEDVDHNGNHHFDLGDAVAVTHSLSWDDNLPSGCVGDPYVFRGVATDCFDGLRVYNQMRPGGYDGMYSFDGLEPGTYVVEVVPPKTVAGDTPYILTKEEDRNLDFGDDYQVSTLMPPAECVGDLHTVPPYLVLVPDAQIPTPAAGQQRPLCDRKRIQLNEGMSGAADFFMFTETPIASHIMGFILDDASNEFDPNAPTFGEKYAPPWMPVSLRDWDGVEIGRTYSDEYGSYNALVPSTWDAHNPLPSGVAPKMITACMNDPGPIPDPAHPGQWMIDPYFNAQYSQFCYTMQFMPGTTTYLDTPVVPVAAFAGPDPYPLDCDADNNTPRIYSVSGPQGGPYVRGSSDVLTITALPPQMVPNPAYDGQNGTQPKVIQRQYGFGTVQGSVTVNGRAATISAWSDGVIRASVASGTSTGELVVTRGDNGKATRESVTLTVARNQDTYKVIRVTPGAKIQPAVDAARPGDLILVPPGTYQELVVMWKPVRLQGWGPGSTHILAVKAPAEKILDWRAKVNSLIASGAVDLIPNQDTGVASPVEPMEPVTLFSEEGPGILVLAKNANRSRGGFGLDDSGLANARIDGFDISGGDNAGGIMVNGYAHYLQVSNNNVHSNAGAYGGGLRIGHPFLLNTAQNDYQSAFNDHVWVHHNAIHRNGGMEAVGGGISLYTGTNNYVIEENLICGNYTDGHGGGIGHLGRSDNGSIARNQIIFNENFFQASSVHGGGIFIGGEDPPPGSLVSPGSGTVSINANLLQGNGATSGDGGGIALLRTNGMDIQRARNDPSRWFHVDITNNFIVNNVAAFAGGGISLQDAALVNLLHNTLVHNDSTATAGDAFIPGNPNQSVPQPAGLVSRAHSPELKGVFGNSGAVSNYKRFSNPLLVNNILWQNRSFFFRLDPAAPPPNFKLYPDVAGGQAPSYWDLGLLGAAANQKLNPLYCDLTSTTGYGASNFSANPSLVASYVNGSTSMVNPNEITTGIEPAPAFDEGGNFIKVRFGPITLTDPATGVALSNGHLQAGSGAVARGMPLILLGLPAAVRQDVDGQNRPVTTPPDVGADQR